MERVEAAGREEERNKELSVCERMLLCLCGYACEEGREGERMGGGGRKEGREREERRERVEGREREKKGGREGEETYGERE